MIVADTNLLVYLLLAGEHTAAAERVLEQDAEWAVPRLWRSEFRNVLAFYLRRGLLSYEAALEVFQQAEQLVEGREYEVNSTQELAFVSESACSAYDCEFISLAHELKAPLVTSDRKMLAAFPGVAVSPAEFGRK